MKRVQGTNGLLAREHLTWLLGSLCGIHRIPFDARLIEQAFPPPHSRATLLRAAQSLSLEAGEVALSAASLAKLTFPCVAFLRASDPARHEQPAAQPVLLLKSDGERVLYVPAGSDTHVTMLAKDVENTFESTAVLFRTSSKSGRSPSPDSEGEPELTGAAAAKFGLRWFIPELLKHRPVWRDVLLASLAIQLAGRATPLFTQVVIDKVVVHHTRSTLIAVGITAPREVAVDREEVHKRRLLEARMRGRPSGSSP